MQFSNDVRGIPCIGMRDIHAPPQGETADILIIFSLPINPDIIQRFFRWRPLNMLLRILRRPIHILCCLIIFTAFVSSAEWQFSVQAPSIPGRRAFLWIPPDAKQVRGLVVGLQNMLEKPLFERDDFRAGIAKSQLGILMIFPGRDADGTEDKTFPSPVRSHLDLFLCPKGPQGPENATAAGNDLQQVLNALADESGYRELRHVPLLPVGHSSAGSFVWHIYRWDANRIIGMLPFKTGSKPDGPKRDIPVFCINSEWFDYGKSSNLCGMKAQDIAGQQRARAGGTLYGYHVDVGSGHCNVSDDSVPMIISFIRKATDARVPANADFNHPVILKPVAEDSGWIIPIQGFGTTAAKPMPRSAWTGDPDQVFWYLDQDLAEHVYHHVTHQLTKKPQQLGFVQPDGQVMTRGGMYRFRPTFVDDMGTFTIEARFIDHLDGNNLYPDGTQLGNQEGEIRYHVNSGGLRQVGPNAFRVCPHAGPIRSQGNPWEPTIVATVLGNAQYRPAEAAAHVDIDILNTKGAIQTLDFPPIPDQSASKSDPIVLRATASSGLPVQYTVTTGPAIVTGNTLMLTAIPIQAKFPIRVTVAAFQWGRSHAQPIQSIGPIERTFLINR
jgi:hypothetical protein